MLLPRWPSTVSTHCPRRSHTLQVVSSPMLTRHPGRSLASHTLAVWPYNTSAHEHCSALHFEPVVWKITQRESQLTSLIPRSHRRRMWLGYEANQQPTNLNSTLLTCSFLYTPDYTECNTLKCHRGQLESQFTCLMSSSVKEDSILWWSCHQTLTQAEFHHS